MKKAVILLAVLVVLCVLVSCRTTETQHTFGDWTVERNLTAFREGLSVRTCTGCGVKEYEPIRDEKCEYSEDGLVVKRVYDESDYELYTYRDAHTVDSLYYNPDGNLEYTSVYEIDDEYNAVTERGYLLTGELLYYQDYDTAFHVTLGIGYNTDGTVNWWEGYVYDSDGTLTQTDVYNTDGTFDHTESLN